MKNEEQWKQRRRWHCYYHHLGWWAVIIRRFPAPASGHQAADCLIKAKKRGSDVITGRGHAPTASRGHLFRPWTGAEHKIDISVLTRRKDDQFSTVHRLQVEKCFECSFFPVLSVLGHLETDKFEKSYLFTRLPESILLGVILKAIISRMYCKGFKPAG